MSKNDDVGATILGALVIGGAIALGKALKSKSGDEEAKEEQPPAARTGTFASDPQAAYYFHSRSYEKPGSAECAHHSHCVHCGACGYQGYCPNCDDD